VFDVRQFELKSTHTRRANLLAAVLGGSADQSLGPGQAVHPDARPHKSCDDTADNTCDVGGTDAERHTSFGGNPKEP
jgi:hypothetical protein